MRSSLSAFVVLAATALARAEPQAAASSFDEGLTHFQNKEYPEAAESFFRAYRLAPHADALYNAGLASELAGRPDTAATAYEMALGKQQLGPEAIEDATQRLEKLSGSLGRVEVSSPEGSTLRVSPFVVGGPKAVFYFEPGRHSIHVTFEGGRRARKSVEAVAGATRVVLIERPAAAHVPQKPAESKPPDHPEKRDDGSAWRTAGWVSLGVAGVATGAAAYFGIQTIRAHDQYLSSGRRDLAARDRTDNLRHWTNAAWATAAITAAGGVGILLFAPDVSTSAFAWPSGARVTGRF